MIALNIELTFNCKATTQEFADRASTTAVPSLSRAASKQADEQRSSLEEVQLDFAPSTEDLNLGLLSLNVGGPEILSQSSQAPESKKTQSFLPLVVAYHKGASYNQTFQVSRLVMDNDKMFASNYPLPEFFMRHMLGHSMHIDKFTVRSPQAMRSGANPIGSGLVFTGDTLSDFEKT